MPAVTTAEGAEADHRITGSGPGLLLVHACTGECASDCVLPERPRQPAEPVGEFPD